MGSKSETNDDSLIISQPTSPISSSFDDSSQFDADYIQRLVLDGPNNGFNNVAERRPPRHQASEADSREPMSDTHRYPPVSKTFDLSKYDVNRPFSYDSVIAAAFLPTFCLALGIVGFDSLFLLLGVFGVVASRLSIDAGYEKRAFYVAVVVFVIFQFTLLFSALPLIWTSVSYFFLLVLLNAFAVLSATWIFLHFRYFRQFDEELTIVLEKILFVAFPLVSLTIQSWMFVSFLSSSSSLPYFLLVVGFVYAQLFLVVRPSSFCRQKTADPADDHQDAGAELPPLVLPAEAALLASGLFAFVPALSFLFVSAEGLFYDFGFYLRFIFLLSVGIFSSTLFISVNDISAYLTHLDLTSRQVRLVKLISGGNSLLCGYLWTVHALSSTSSSAWLPWLPLFACVHVGIGAAAGTSKTVADRRRALSLTFGAFCVFSLAYSAFFFQFPLLRRVRGLTFHFGNSFSVSIRAFVILLFLLSISGAFIVVSPVFASRRRLHPAFVALVVVFHSSAFHFAETLLFLHDVYPFGAVLISAGLFALFYYRMYRVESSSSHFSSWTSICVWIGLCLTLSKVYFASLIHWDADLGYYENDGFGNFLHFTLVFLVIAGVSGLTLFHDKIQLVFGDEGMSGVSAEDRRRYRILLDRRLLLPPALLLQICAHFAFVRPLWTRWFETEAMTFADASSVHMLFTGILIKILYSDEISALTPSSTSSSASLYGFWFSLCASVFLLQPELSTNAENAAVWMRLTGVSTFLHLLFLGDASSLSGKGVPSPKSWLFYSYGIGVPLAAEVLTYLNVVDVGFNLHSFLYAATIVVAVSLALGEGWPLLFSSSSSSTATDDPDVDDPNTEPNFSSHRRRFFVETVAPKMKIGLICLTLSTSVMEWVKSPASITRRRWNDDVDIFLPNTPSMLRLTTVLFPSLTFISKLAWMRTTDYSCDVRLRRDPLSLRQSKWRTFLNRLAVVASDAATLNNLLVFISFFVVSSRLSWTSLHPTSRQLFFLLIPLHCLLLRPDPLLFPPSNILGFRTDHPSFFVAAALVLYCGILEIAAISGSRFWRLGASSASSTASFLHSVLYLMEILSCVTLVPCAAALTARLGGTRLFSTSTTTFSPSMAASVSLTTIPMAVILFFIATSGSARIVAVLELAFSLVLLACYLVQE